MRPPIKDMASQLRCPGVKELPYDHLVQHNVY